MKTLAISTTLMLLTGIGWANSMTEAQPANGWLLALIASTGTYLHTLNKLEKNNQ